MAKNEELIQEILGQYRNRGAYTPKTSAENKARAEDEVRAYYDQLRLGAQQQQERADLALQQQRAGLQDTYDRQREASAQEYRQRYSQADRQMLSRGMQRSSYGAQVLANIGQRGAEAQQRLWDAQGAAEGNIDAQRAQLAEQLGRQLQQYDASRAADVLKRSRELDDQEYERAQADQARRDQTGMQLANMLRQAERDQVSDEQFEKQFGLSKQQFEAQLANQQWQRDYQAARDAVADAQWQQNYDFNAQKWADTLAEQMYQRQYQEGRDAVKDAQWQQTYNLQAGKAGGTGTGAGAASASGASGGNGGNPYSSREEWVTAMANNEIDKAIAARAKKAKSTQATSVQAAAGATANSQPATTAGLIQELSSSSVGKGAPATPGKTHSDWLKQILRKDVTQK